MLHCSFDYFLLNHQIRKSGEFSPELFDKGKSIYEVFRLIDRVPVFYQEHMKRLFDTSRLIRFPLWLDPGQIQQDVITLIRKNKVKEGNVELIFNVWNNDIRQDRNFLALFIENRYPGPEAYNDGVATALFQGERPLPNAKQIILELRKSTVKAITEKKLYEVILVDRSGRLTEGSRTNMFFIHGNVVYTPPLHQVLPGITRDKVFEICKTNKMQIVEKEIAASEIESFDAAFLTGTSPNVLPIASIDDVVYNPQNELLRKIILAFNHMVRKYVEGHKNLFDYEDK